jgi:hypothetical protein
MLQFGEPLVTLSNKSIPGTGWRELSLTLITTRQHPISKVEIQLDEPIFPSLASDGLELMMLLSQLELLLRPSRAAVSTVAIICTLNSHNYGAQENAAAAEALVKKIFDFAERRRIKPNVQVSRTNQPCVLHYKLCTSRLLCYTVRWSNSFHFPLRNSASRCLEAARSHSSQVPISRVNTLPDRIRPF